MHATSSWLAPTALAVVLVSSAATAATSRQCSDSCIDAARGERKDCAASATEVFGDTFTGCLARDHQCVDACRTERQDCRDATSLGADLVACQLELDAEELRCRQSFPPASRRLVICIGRAQVAGFQCRRGAFRALRLSLKDCRSGFAQCTEACGPGGPPGGADSCRAQAKSALGDALAQCKVAYRTTATACLEKDLTCTQDCGEARDACDAPTQAVLDDALASCTAERNAALAACQGANPEGGTALQECISAAQAMAFACREATIEASLPGFASCTASYVGCVRACPPA